MFFSQKMAPVMRRLLQSNIKQHLIVSGVLCTISMIATKILINDPRKAKYAEFYKFVFHSMFQKNVLLNFVVRIWFCFRTYDAEKDFNRMVQAGIFQSVKP